MNKRMFLNLFCSLSLFVCLLGVSFLLKAQSQSNNDEYISSFHEFKNNNGNNWIAGWNKRIGNPYAVYGGKYQSNGTESFNYNWGGNFYNENYSPLLESIQSVCKPRKPFLVEADNQDGPDENGVALPSFIYTVCAHDGIELSNSAEIKEFSQGGGGEESLMVAAHNNVSLVNSTGIHGSAIVGGDYSGKNNADLHGNLYIYGSISLQNNADILGEIIQLSSAPSPCSYDTPRKLDSELRWTVGSAKA